MAGALTETGAQYSSVVGIIYVFNLIVGTGALTMPKAFGEAGWLLGLISVFLLCIMSLITVTFVVEVMASANAVLSWKKLQSLKKAGDISDKDIARQLDPDFHEETEQSPLLHQSTCRSAKFNASVKPCNYYEISERIEMGQMASTFFSRCGVNLFYICIAVYLYGDLAIYAAAVPKSLRDVACYKVNVTNNSEGNDETDLCWPGTESKITRFSAYRIFLLGFTLFLGPFTFFNAQKTKYLQLFTSVMRWVAFLIMIIVAAIRLAQGEGHGSPPVAQFAGVPTLFGVCVYSFMCHHSLPSLVTPMRDKSHLFSLLAAIYVTIFTFYMLLSFTAVFTFSKLEDLYTLNFEPTGGADAVVNVVFIQYFLALFPVFTLSTNFPIIAITLRNNLSALFLRDSRSYHCCVTRLLFPLLTIAPPIVVSFFTNNLEFLVGITGSYAGAGIQYVLPAFLVYYARLDTRMILGSGVKNAYRSPFSHTAWVVIVLLWAAAAVVFVTVNHILTKL
ncbi:PREDICTED: transmembrane protein 104-like [Priapulus caudatus]|uniref:Transmembrane protein 104-like n=1 Tax=Priapulus caudatus TaxID=37621 RepID=A0ABM1ETV0_PRICU|nr:PREDICTED: transmembrane protein 104-like [Priapulus caudatus]